jgi:hypothetical protein
MAAISGHWQPLVSGLLCHPLHLQLGPGHPDERLGGRLLKRGAHLLGPELSGAATSAMQSCPERYPVDVPHNATHAKGLKGAASAQKKPFTAPGGRAAAAS